MKRLLILNSQTKIKKGFMMFFKEKKEKREEKKKLIQQNKEQYKSSSEIQREVDMLKAYYRMKYQSNIL